ncbi:hypothetical protein AGRA3207_007043 [Actinomadura graeca]|uniref:Uncharacterized protein n=1 Tax=Actinomadura graeca TaxID=2750812 RepID=A0ABX8R3C3_9ACTN|nr:hypothetical protein [Actinomadura graeca]QXJ25535.1 hypothetical protein AGRA3207_007043 [Actinomadura graeca]
MSVPGGRVTRVRWWGTGLVACVLLVLGAGLPLLDAALGAGGRPVRPGTVLSVGTERDGTRPVSFAVPSAGWTLSEERSFLGGNAFLTRDEVAFNISVVVPLAPLDAPALWDGLAKLVTVGRDRRLGTAPATITTVHGLRGLTGHLTGDGRAGTAAVFATRRLGATVTASGPPGAYRRVAAQVDAMMRTVRISP